jgi:hypothetical protein
VAGPGIPCLPPSFAHRARPCRGFVAALFRRDGCGRHEAAELVVRLRRRRGGKDLANKHLATLYGDGVSINRTLCVERTAQEMVELLVPGFASFASTGQGLGEPRALGPGLLPCCDCRRCPRTRSIPWSWPSYVSYVYYVLCQRTPRHIHPLPRSAANLFRGFKYRQAKARYCSSCRS